jgi:1,5-anhydro-D-fructose reductase (1,5-anhydro-D-mannitol-forming)
MAQQTIHWGIIGCGDVAEYKSGPALYLTPGSELVAVMRRDATKAQDFARRHGAKRWYTDAESLVADPEVNAVYIASPHYWHPEHVALAARAHKIVLCEKPMGANVAQAQACVDVCKVNGVPLTVAYYRRFWPIAQAMLRFLREGAIGQVVHARVQITDYFAGDSERSWLTSLAKSGGDALANAGAHWVDLIRFLLGDVADVMAYCSSKFSGFETDDTAVVEMRMVDGALVSLTSTRQTPISTNELDIFGTEGRLYASPLSDGRLVLHRRGRAPEALEYPRQGVTHSGLVAELIKCLLNRQPSPLPGEEAVATWKIMEAAYRSSAEGVRIVIK